MPKGLTIELDAETYNALQQLAQFQGQTLTEVAQDGLRDWTNTVGQARLELHQKVA